MSPSFEAVARVDDIPEGELLAVEKSDGTRICLVNLGGGEILALSDSCTHQDFPMAAGTLLPDGTIECAWHGARFDCRTGAVRKPPATEPIPVYEVRVADGDVLVGARKG
jgi:3-phenylpropionate/trans-cinnamate dioxygenase ferredoxin subunit